MSLVVALFISFNLVHAATRTPAPLDALTATALIAELRRTDPYLRAYTPLVDVPAARLTFDLIAEDGVLRFKSVSPHSNLDRVGVGPGDRLVEVEGQSITPRTAAAVVTRLPPGETVRLTVETIAGEVRGVAVDRRESTDVAVAGYVMMVNGRRLGVVRLQNFNDSRACARTETWLRRLGELRVDGLIYDLRGNPGGRVEQARCVLGLHLGRGKVVWRQRLLRELPAYAQARGEFRDVETVFTDRDRVAPRVPTVVLINAGTASASELAAAAWREREVAWMVGARSFGKGVTQTVLPLVPGYSEPRAWKTIARTEQRGGYSVQGHGVNPDFVVKSELGGRHDDADDERRPRFTELFGRAFVTTEAVYRRPPARARAYAKVKRCVRVLSLTAGGSALRWLRDLQLRGAAAVALCAE